MIGRTIPVRGLAAVLALVVLASCRRAPKCEGELERDDLYLLQKLENDGKYPCPEHLQPAIEVRPNGVTLNGKRVASREALPVGTPRRIQGLFNALKQNRETWKQVHPGMSFDAHPKIDIDGACDFGTGAGALMSTAFAGYPNALVRSGGVVFEMYYAVPGPLMPDDQRPRPTELLVVRKGEGRYVPAVRQGTTIMDYAPQGLEFDAVPGWVAGHCPAGRDPCVDVIVLGLSGEFAVAATLIRSILDGPGFRTRLPTLRFVTDAS